MAFNPFHQFRKYQKTLLAGLTIFCMVIFVLQTGLSKGDFFGLLERSGARRQSDRAATLYGKPVTAIDIGELQRQRTFADMYIRIAIRVGQSEVMRKVSGELTSELKSDENSLKVINQAKGIHDYLTLVLGRQPGMNLGQIIQLLFQSSMQLQNLQSNFLAQKRETAARITKELADVLQQDRQMMMQPPDQLYFGGTNKNLRDLLHFKMWLHQADRLGIQLSNADIGMMMNQEALEQLNSQGFRIIRDTFLNTYRNVDEETVSEALTNEFRVRLAKAAFLGYNQRPDIEESFVVPPAVTPLECWEFFRKQRTESEVALLPISVRSKDFLVEAGKPTEDELKTLYDRYKLMEPVPGLPTFGFKQPERIEVEWVNARADSPWYQEQAKRTLQVMQHTIQATSGNASLAGGLAGQVGAVLPWAVDLPLVGKYETVTKHRFPVASWFDSWRAHVLHEQNMFRAENLASLVGQAIAGGGTGGSILTGPVAYLATGTGFELRERIRVGSQLILSGSHPLPWTAAGLAYGVSPREEYKPLAAIRQHVETNLVNDLARDMVHANLSKVMEELFRLSWRGGDHLLRLENATQPSLIAAALGQAVGSAVTGGSPLAAPVAYSSQVVSRDIRDAQQRLGRLLLAGSTRMPFTMAAALYQEESLPDQRAREYLAKAIPEYHLQHGTTNMPRNHFNIGDDPGMEPLKRSFSSLPATEGHERNFEQLMFFNDRFNAYMPKRWPHMPSQQGFSDPEQPDPIWNVSDEPFVYWRTGTFSAYVPSFDEAKPHVEEAWRIEKARKFAQAEADRLAAEAQKAGADALRVLKDGSKHSSSLVYLDNVAKREKPMFAFASRQMDANTYRPYQIPTAKVEYPSSDFLDKLLDLKEKGQVTVLADRPETTYYVAALVSRNQPDEAAFYQDYSKYAAALLNLIEQDKQYRERWREAIVKRLESEAGLDISKEYEQKFNNPRSAEGDEQ